jgi:hypothetical protein
MNDNGVILHVSIFSQQASEPECWRRKESSTNRRCLLHLMHLFPTDSREPFRKVVYCRTLVEMLEQSGNRKARTLKAASPAKFTSVSIDRYTATPVHITNLIGRRLAQMPVSANPRIRRLKSPHCRWEKSASTENSLGNTLARKRPVPVVASVSVPGATPAPADLRHAVSLSRSAAGPRERNMPPQNPVHNFSRLFHRSQPQSTTPLTPPALTRTTIFLDTA